MRRLLLAGITAALALAPAAEAHTLSYGKAKTAAQRKADAFAGQHTEVNALIRQSRHRYYAQARWQTVESILCPFCGYDPGRAEFVDTTIPKTTYCSAELSVRFRSRSSRRLVARVTGHTCF